MGITINPISPSIGGHQSNSIQVAVMDVMSTLVFVIVFFPLVLFFVQAMFERDQNAEARSCYNTSLIFPLPSDNVQHDLQHDHSSLS